MFGGIALLPPFKIDSKVGLLGWGGRLNRGDCEGADIGIPCDCRGYMLGGIACNGGGPRGRGGIPCWKDPKLGGGCEPITG